MHARVAQVERDGTLVLRDGRALKLEGLRLALPEGRALSSRTQAALRSLAFGGPVNFTTVSPERDRYGRIRVQAFGRLWFQTALLEQGLARVQLSPDRDECAPDLYEAEARARSHRIGLWASPDYRVRTARTLTDTTGTFQLVEGMVSHIGRADGRTFVDFDADPKSPFSAVIGLQDRHAFRDYDFDGLSGRHVRIRGIVQDYRGRPEIELSNPA
ncbi:MAG TPA: thermonuclease family protein, partial [Rhizomicrobium sp.]|nr:thermonuclease family protein [Rhizomicrobium sp.]